MVSIESPTRSAGEVGAELGVAAAGLDLAALSADLELAADRHGAVLGDLERGRLEAEARVALDVEELGGEQVALQLRLVDVDAGDVDGAGQAGSSPPVSDAS